MYTVIFTYPLMNASAHASYATLVADLADRMYNVNIIFTVFIIMYFMLFAIKELLEYIGKQR